jgi:hypothetical protein
MADSILSIQEGVRKIDEESMPATEMRTVKNEMLKHTDNLSSLYLHSVDLESTITLIDQCATHLNSRTDKIKLGIK